MDVSSVVLIIWLIIIAIMLVLVVYVFNRMKSGEEYDKTVEKINEKEASDENKKFYNVFKTQNKAVVTFNTGEIQSPEARDIIRKLVDDHINQYGIYQVLEEEQISRLGHKMHEANIIYLNSLRLIKKDRMHRAIEIYLKGKGVIGYVPYENAAEVSELMQEYGGYNSKLHIVGGFLGGSYNYYDEELRRVVSKNENCDIILEIHFHKDLKVASSEYIDKEPDRIPIYSGLTWTTEYINFLYENITSFNKNEERIPQVIKDEKNIYKSQFRITPYVCPSCRTKDRFLYKVDYRNKIEEDIVNKYNCNGLKRVVSCDINRDAIIDVDNDINFEKVDSGDLGIDKVYTCKKCNKFYLSFYTSRDPEGQTSYPLSRHALASDSVLNQREYERLLEYFVIHGDKSKYLPKEIIDILMEEDNRSNSMIATS